MSGNGLEHQRSSENGMGTGYFTDWDKKAGSSDLLGHEYTHSWNGKYRRPDGLWKPNYNVPMKGSRSEGRRGGKECVRKCRSRWSPDHTQKKKKATKKEP